MMVSEVALSRCIELELVIARELRPALAVGDSPRPRLDCGRSAVIAAALSHLHLRPADSVAVSHLGVHCAGRCCVDVVDTFPKRCRSQSARLR
jgi:hypothetical protein